jgi:TPR repeat protein
MRAIGFRYMEGRGVARDYAQALGWSRKAADAGDAGGMNNLGILYTKGMGTPKDDAQAMNCIKRSPARATPIV